VCAAPAQQTQCLSWKLVNTLETFELSREFVRWSCDPCVLPGNEGRWQRDFILTTEAAWGGLVAAWRVAVGVGFHEKTDGAALDSGVPTQHRIILHIN